MTSPDLYDGLLAKHGVSPGGYRLRVHTLAWRVLERSLNTLGIQTLAAPSSAMDEEGYLLPDLRLGCTHGNGQYGRMVLNEIDQLLLSDESASV